MISSPSTSGDDPVPYLFRGTALQGETRTRMEAKLRERLKLGRPLRVKLGLDPTKPFLHIGHLAPLLALKRFADLGHQTYLLIGGFTAMIGDPSGRRRDRQAITEEQVKINTEIYAKEIFGVLDPSRTIVVNNATWFDCLRLLDFFLTASKVTVSRVLEPADFKRRFDSDDSIGLQELLYPVAQAYDSMVLCAALPGREADCDVYRFALANPNAYCDVEVGGDDQLSNFMITQELMEKHGLPAEIFITTPLIQGRDGQKMGKGEGNVVRFSDTSSAIYSAVMSFDDSVIVPYMTSITTISNEELSMITRGLRSGELGRHEAKQRLAYEVAGLIHGTEAADQAQEEWEARRYRKV